MDLSSINLFAAILSFVLGVSLLTFVILPLSRKINVLRKERSIRE